MGAVAGRREMQSQEENLRRPLSLLVRFKGWRRCHGLKSEGIIGWLYLRREGHRARAILRALHDPFAAEAIAAVGTRG